MKLRVRIIERITYSVILDDVPEATSDDDIIAAALQKFKAGTYQVDWISDPNIAHWKEEATTVPGAKLWPAGNPEDPE